MANNINLLIIEDEDAQLQMYEDAIESHNEKNDIKITYVIKKNFEDGKMALLSPFYDAAIIDLKLSSNGDALEGKELVTTVYKKIRVPIFIVSGSIAQIDDIPENALLKKHLRTDDILEILNSIRKIYQTGLTSFLRPNGLIDEKLTEIFWKNLSRDIGIWIEHENRNSLLRYILSHFQEYLEINTDGDFDDYHPKEIYLAPPIKQNLHTGDLIKIENEYYLVLTPACDIVLNYKNDEKGNKTPYRKAEKLILVHTKQFDCKELCSDRKGNIDKSKIKNYVTNSQYRYHYLPPFNNETGFLIDFQNILSTSFDSQYTREATIAPQFLKDIISRFGSYYSRQGQPTFNQDRLVEHLFELQK